MFKKLKKVALIAFAILALIVTGNWLRLNYESYFVKLQGKSLVSATLDQDFTLVKNQLAFISSENLYIKLLKITYQPCPEHVACFWSGLGADFEVTKDGQKQNSTTALESNINNIYFGYEIDLTYVQPTKVNFKVKKVL